MRQVFEEDFERRVDVKQTPIMEIEILQAESVRITSDTLHVDLSDGRTISVPVGWYPRLAHASAEERKEWRLIAQGRGIHWEAIDEDISVEGLLAGRPSGESQSSFKQWLGMRQSRLTKRPTATRKAVRADHSRSHPSAPRKRGAKV